MLVGYTTTATVAAMATSIATTSFLGAGLNSCHPVFGGHYPYHSLKYLDLYLTSLWGNSNRFSLLQWLGGPVIHCFDFFTLSKMGSKRIKRYQVHEEEEEKGQAGVVKRPTA